MQDKLNQVNIQLASRDVTILTLNDQLKTKEDQSNLVIENNRQLVDEVKIMQDKLKSCEDNLSV